MIAAAIEVEAVCTLVSVFELTSATTEVEALLIRVSVLALTAEVTAAV